MMPEVLSIGPAVLSVQLLLVAAAAAGAVAATWLILGRQRDALRRTVIDTATTAGLLFFLAWKLTPLLTQFETVRREPLLLLYAGGGRIGVMAGLLLSAIYVGRTLLGRADAAELARAAALTLAAGLVLYLTGYSAVALVSTLTDEELAGTRIGDPAPPLVLETLEQELVDLAQLRGAPVVISFWATWCAPCRAEAVVKNRLAREFAGKIHVLGVNLTRSEAGIGAVRDFADRWNINHPILLDTAGRAAAAYGVRGTPTTVVVDADGMVHARIFGAMTYGAAVRAVRSAAGRSVPATLSMPE